MGLMVHSLSNIPESANRDYWIYLLDYGWKEPLSSVMNDNFYKIAEEASMNRAVVIRGVGFHFENEVLSWHHINNIKSDKILPAILITNRHPSYFRHNSRFSPDNPGRGESELNMILIPLNDICKTETDVVNIFKSIFEDIRNKTSLAKFEIVEQMERGKNGSLADTLIVRPTIWGVGLDVMALIRRFSNKQK